jgi:hypothetical protein
VDWPQAAAAARPIHSPPGIFTSKLAELVHLSLSALARRGSDSIHRWRAPACWLPPALPISGSSAGTDYRGDACAGRTALWLTVPVCFTAQRGLLASPVSHSHYCGCDQVGGTRARGARGVPVSNDVADVLV